jgi:GxxExxY protein
MWGTVSYHHPGVRVSALAMPPSTLNVITHDVIGAAIEVHRYLGPGLLESMYLECICHELRMRNVVFDREVPLPLRYKGLVLQHTYRLDLLVAGCIVVELKAVEKLLAIHRAQLHSYLKLKRLPLGLLINFNVCNLSSGITRIAN